MKRNETKLDDEEDAAEGEGKTAANGSLTTNTGKKHKIFCGWIAFCLYGLHATAEMQLDILKVVEDKEKNSDKTRGWVYG